jgi:hypothetical protein
VVFILLVLVAALEGDGPDDDDVVDGRQSSADEGTDPEDPLQQLVYHRSALDQNFSMKSWN